MAENEIQKVEPTEIQQAQLDHSPIPIDAPLMTRLAMMMERGIKIDTDQMSKMLEIAERLKATAAKEAYAVDFAVVQANIDGAVKTARNPQTGSMYAKLEGVIEASKPAYTAQGFSVVFYEGVTEVEGHIRVCADVLHRDGHKEPYHYDVPLGGVGIAGKVNMTAIHAKATSVTYGRRYLLCMIWNIPTQDDDGNGSGKPPVDIPQPTAENMLVIDAICSKIQCPPGKRVDVKQVTSILFARYQKYPAHEGFVGPGVVWFDEMDRPELFIPENRSQAEIDLGMLGDEDSRPDTEADKTAAEKFGEENDQVELRYYCTKCDKEFEEFKIKGVCANTDCLSRDIIDRQKS